MLGVEGLHDRLTGALTAPGPPGDLGQQLKRALGSAEVGKTKPDVGRDDADQRHAREVVPLGDHLRADEDVELTARETAEE